MNILVIAPHPDDDIIGCGGSIIKHLKAGNTVSIIYLTSGELGGKIDSEKLGKLREKEAQLATSSLGIPKNSLYFLRQQDGYLNSGRQLILSLIKLIHSLRPEMVYLPHVSEAHPDHKMANTVSLNAIAKAAMIGQDEPWEVKTILAYEVWTPIQDPNYLEDITLVNKQKIEALAYHKSQLNIVSYDDMANGLSAYRGLLLGKNRKAEAFSILQLDTSNLTKQN